METKRIPENDWLVAQGMVMAGMEYDNTADAVPDAEKLPDYVYLHFLGIYLNDAIKKERNGKVLDLCFRLREQFELHDQHAAALKDTMANIKRLTGDLPPWLSCDSQNLEMTFSMQRRFYVEIMDNRVTNNNNGADDINQIQACFSIND